MTESANDSFGIKWQCTTCLKTYSQLKSFNKHKCLIPGTKKPCPSCNKLISYKFLPNHIKMHSVSKVKCSKCARIFISTEKLDKHMKCHKDVYQCSSCSSMFENSRLLKKHTKLDHSDTSETDKKELKCKFCHDVFEYPDHLFKHMEQTHSQDATIKCQICPKKYFGKRGLRKHMKDHVGVKTVPLNENIEEIEIFDLTNVVIEVADAWRAGW